MVGMGFYFGDDWMRNGNVYYLVGLIVFNPRSCGARRYDQSIKLAPQSVPLAMLLVFAGVLAVSS